MTLQFPLTMTFAELAAAPEAADNFSWDDSMIEEGDDDTTLVAQIRDYSQAYYSAPKLANYLTAIGYSVTNDNVTVRSENALRLASALFGQIAHEYDAPESEIPTVPHPVYPNAWPRTPPTWALFELGGDDDVDYCGTQPSCLTDLLLHLHDDYEIACGEDPLGDWHGRNE